MKTVKVIILIFSILMVYGNAVLCAEIFGHYDSKKLSHNIALIYAAISPYVFAYTLWPKRRDM